MEKEEGGLLTEMILSGDSKEESPADLIVEPKSREGRESFTQDLTEALRQTEKELANLQAAAQGAKQSEAWSRAMTVVQQFHPVPWFIWRLSNFAIGKPGTVNKVSEALVLGLRRLLFAAASDPALGVGRKVNSNREALEILSSDVIAAISIIHAVSRRLLSRPFERIWRPILDDALIRARIGYFVGKEVPNFGSGRGMLAGFSGRAGLAVLISTGDVDMARQCLESLATGGDIGEVGMKLYGCEPVQVSALLLSASGCGKDAAYGTVAFSALDPKALVSSEEQKRWLAAFTIVEAFRMNSWEGVDNSHWDIMNITQESQKKLIMDETRKLIRQSHGWSWLV